MKAFVFIFYPAKTAKSPTLSGHGSLQRRPTEGLRGRCQTKEGQRNKERKEEGMEKGHVEDMTSSELWNKIERLLPDFDDTLQV
ncbi:MAG: hypothetical protein LBD54_01125 [Puniceicoccales bacterium]|jgi:hypothetical protein|nr:hypothetical protein [Puniceicoccales bacterium]